MTDTTTETPAPTAPFDIPWKLVAVSPDMMDTTYCNKKFPFTWRSSLAISAYEPDDEKLPDAYGDRRISYLKITCSITGYQPSADETKKGLASFPNVPTEDLTRILSEYFGCYGVLINVGVFPDSASENDKPSVSTYPCFIDFEPKERDLIQAATMTGELLTASESEARTDKTLTHTKTTETGLSLEGKYKTSEKAGAEIGGKLSHKWGETDQDKRTVQADASRERSEKEGTNTTISQMYNLLTGYHLGTNRATFLMLPRPHTLQPTNRRTFIQGLRVIEGIQEFFLIVSRPKNMDRYCIEANLETGHFPEKVDIDHPEVQYETGDETFWVQKTGEWGTWGSDVVNIDTTHAIENGWDIDRTKGDNGHPGISMIQDASNDQARDSLKNYNYKAISDSTVEVTGTIEGHSYFFDGTDANFKRPYKVFKRKQKPKDGDELPEVTTDFLITSRGLCVCLGHRTLQLKQDHRPESIVDLTKIKVKPQYTGGASSPPQPIPDLKQLLNDVKIAMSRSARLPTRRPFGEVGFLESDYFKNRIRAVMQKEDLDRPITEIDALQTKLIDRLGGSQLTVGDILSMDLSAFVHKSELSAEEAIVVRNRLLGRTEE